MLNEENKGGRGESFLCFNQSTEQLDPAITSPLILLKLNFNGLAAVLPYVCVFVDRRCVCILLHSHFPLQVERLLHIVVATAQVDEGDIAADRHLLLMLLLQLKGTLQVLVRQQNSRSQDQTYRQSKLISRKKNRESFVRH